MKCCIGIVLYNPSTDDLKRLQTYVESGFFEDVLVYDNSLSSYQSQVPSTVKYTFYNENKGLSVPYNQMIEYCITHQYDYLCVMDQDSNYPLEEMKKLIDFINTHPQELTNTGIVAPRVYYKTTDKQQIAQNKLTVVKWTINSGSFLNIKYLNLHQLRYDEKVFVAAVDFDFCWSVRERNGLIQIYEGSLFLQNLGKPLFIGKKEYRSNTAVRYYYIAKNRKYVYRKHMGYVVGSAISILKTMSNIYRIIHIENDKFLKIKACLKGALF